MQEEEQEKKEYEYVVVPLSAVRLLHTHPVKGVSELFNLGILETARRIRTNLYKSVRLAYYFFYRKRDELPEELRWKLEDLRSEKVFHGPVFFEDGEFDSDIQVDDIITYIKNDTKLKSQLLAFNRLESVKTILRIKFNTSAYMNSLIDYKEEQIKGQPLILVKTKMLFNFLNNEKTEYEIEMFACYLGLRSIIGNKNFAYTTKNYIACRMIGVKSPAHLKEVIDDENLYCVYDKYSKRYHMDKLLNMLVKKKFIVKLAVPALRRIYITTRLTLDELCEHIAQDASQRKKAATDIQKKEQEAAKRLLALLSSSK